jgi:hypothetical protein
MLAMVVNADAGSLTPPGVLRFFASMLAPTGGLWQPQAKTNGPMYY